jgi:DNA-directed RNA polymerase specialized sigma24 family protein
VASARQPAEPAGHPDFESWVAARAPALGRLAYLLTGSADEADAVVVEALAAAHARWGRLARGDSLEAQVQVLTSRACLRRHRDGHRAPAGALPEALAAPADPRRQVSDPAPLLDEHDAAVLWCRCEDLTARQRAALVLRCHEGMGPAEIAAAVGCRRGTALSALREALAHVVPADAVPRGGEARVARVRQVLREYAERAPVPYIPAERAAALSRRTGRRRRLVGGVAATALVVPAAWAAVTTGAWSPQRPAEPPGPRLQASGLDTSGWRWESWGGVQMQVPPGWGHADLTQWCTARGPSGPAVDRPELRSTHALCSLTDDGRPTYTGGLLLRRADDGLRLSRADVAPYATVRLHTVGDVTLTVVDIDPAVGSVILASAQVVGRRDHNGCAPRLGTAPASGELAALVDVDSVSVCRYGLTGWDRPTLISSRRLEALAADDVLHGVRHAPVGPATRPPGRCRRPAQELATLVLWDDGRATTAVVRYDGCGRHGLNDAVHHRVLTGEVLYPVLVPPWTGRLTADVREAMAPHGAHPDPEDSIRPAAPGGQLTSGAGVAAR